MLIVVPEGTHDVTVSHNGSRATQTIQFVRNEEIAWDLGTVEIAIPKTGTILFTITPDNAKVVIDGAKTDISAPVELTYGVHQITITADGYETLAKYIKVGAASANIAIDLEKSKQNTTNENDKDTDETETETENETETAVKEETSKDISTPDTTTESEAETLEAASTTYKVHIDSPEGVEVYLDGNYIGIAPVDFKKEPGNYIITLRKDGYQTRSYTLQVDEEEKDVNFSFSELLAK